jgi:hypothetical protein
VQLFFWGLSSLDLSALFAMAATLVAEHVPQAACYLGSVLNSGQNQLLLLQLMCLHQAAQIQQLLGKRQAMKTKKLEPMSE